MSSEFIVVCDAVVTDLQGHIEVLAASEVEVHKYAPWDPEALVADGKKHLAVWPSGEEAEAREVLTNDAHQVSQIYHLAYWEPNEAEAARLVVEEEATKTFLNLHQAMRARFYIVANQRLGGSELLWYAGSMFPDEVAGVRWMVLSFVATHYIAFEEDS